MESKIDPYDIISPIGQKNVYNEVANTEQDALMLATYVNSAQKKGKFSQVSRFARGQDTARKLSRNLFDVTEKQISVKEAVLKELSEKYPSK